MDRMKIIIISVAAFLLALTMGAQPSRKALAADTLLAIDKARALGISYYGLTQGESPVFDYNNDKKRDIFLMTHNREITKFLRNNGRGFEEIFQGTFPLQDRHGCIVGDFGSTNGGGMPDGRPDMYCVVGACQGRCTKEYPNELWLQTPEQTFVDVASTWRVNDPRGRGREAVAIDYNRDGLLDIAVANAAPSIFETPNRLFKNLGGRFEEVRDAVLRQEKDSMCVAAADINKDGWKDLVFCSTTDPNARILTYQNMHGVFMDATANTTYRTIPARDIEFANLDGLGGSDLLIVGQKRVSVWLNKAGSYPPATFSQALDEGHDLAVCDIDQDVNRRADIFVVQGYNGQYPDLLLINNGSGTSFTSQPIRLATEGHGDVATCIPRWGNTGRGAVLVTNGRWSVPGPTQFITFSAPPAQ